MRAARHKERLSHPHAMPRDAAPPLWRLLLATGRALSQLDRRAAVAQAYQLCRSVSVFFIVVVMSCVGAILVLQSASQIKRLLGDMSLIGPAFLQLVVREFGPTIVALMVAARYGAGVAAELGAMRISEQIDALRMTGAEPVPYLVLPRVVGGVVGMIPLAIFGTAVAFAAGGVTAQHVFGIGWDTYAGTRLVSLDDVFLGLAKAGAFGAAVPLVACQAGLATRGGAPGVGRAATQAVIGGSILVIALDFVLGALGYLAFG